MVDEGMWVYNFGVIRVILIGKNWSIGIKPCYSVAIYASFPTWNDLGLYLDISGNYKIWVLFHPVSYTFTMHKEQIIFHLFLTFGTSFRWVVSFTFWQLYPSQGVGVELYFASSVCLLDLVLKIKHRTTFMELIQT